jgi:hypothetical protein
MSLSSPTFGHAKVAQDVRTHICISCVFGNIDSNVLQIFKTRHMWRTFHCLKDEFICSSRASLISNRCPALTDKPLHFLFLPNTSLLFHLLYWSASTPRLFFEPSTPSSTVNLLEGCKLCSKEQLLSPNKKCTF